MERYFLRSDKDNFWFVPISDKVESHMYKFTVTGNGPPKMYRYVGNGPIDLSTFHELTDINQFSEPIITIYQFVHLFNAALSINKY